MEKSEIERKIQEHESNGWVISTLDEELSETHIVYELISPSGINYFSEILRHDYCQHCYDKTKEEIEFSENCKHGPRLMEEHKIAKDLYELIDELDHLNGVYDQNET